jgi:hypothetical protein
MKLNLYIILISFFIFQSCDKELTSFDSDVINSENAIDFSTGELDYSILSKSEIINPVQSNNLPSFLIGKYNHPQFGNSYANFVGQMVPADYNHDFGDNVELDSVILSIPYYSRAIDTDENLDVTYEIDSVYGNNPIKISIYKNNFFLRTFDPFQSFDSSQNYFTNGSLSNNEQIDISQLEGQLLFEIDDFVPNANQINLTAVDTSGETYISQKLAPALRFKLNNPNNNFWETLFFNNEGLPNLSNEPDFKEFFRGLYIKTEGLNSSGSMMLLNLASSNAKLTIHYTSDNEVVNNDTGSTDDNLTNQHEYVLNFSGNLVNIFENENLVDVNGTNTVDGNENIYLRGGEGIITTLDLFSGSLINDNGEEISEFDHFKDFFYDNISDSPKRLINEAYIEFYVNQNFINSDEPERIFIYNYEQNTALIDYFLDQSVSSTTINAKINHLVPLIKDSLNDNRGIKYKIRITEHLNNLVLKDSSNSKLGLGVMSNISSVQNFTILGDEDSNSNNSLAAGIILSPKGTILHGNLSPEIEKRPRIKIYYTEPED